MTCTTQGCTSQKDAWDDLFCPKCREDWRTYVRINELDSYFEVNLNSIVREGLDTFRSTHILGTQ